jgi:hypothetical protein
MIAVGDLIYLGVEQRVGIVLAAVPVEPYKLRHITSPISGVIDLKVLWSDGSIGWCLGEAVIILSSRN